MREPRLGSRFALFVQPRGEREHPVGTSYGHTGFTGPSVWIDPGSKSFVIIMANRVHPKGEKEHQ